MTLIRTVIRSSLSLQNRSAPSLTRPFSAQPLSGDDYKNSFNSSESTDESEKQSFSFSSIYKDLHKRDNTKYRAGNVPSLGLGSDYGILDGPDGVSDAFSDGMEFKLKKAATYFEFDHDEVSRDNYTFRPDYNFQSGMTYDTKDLDLQIPGVHRPRKRPEFVTTTEEVLRKADFRNVRFLANFMTEAGLIIKRSKTGISEQAQRKVAREIKTARAFGLMPFTSMGSKHFVPGTSMEDHAMDFGYEAHEADGYDFVDDDLE